MIHTISKKRHSNYIICYYVKYKNDTHFKFWRSNEKYKSNNIYFCCAVLFFEEPKLRATTVKWTDD